MFHLFILHLFILYIYTGESKICQGRQQANDACVWFLAVVVRPGGGGRQRMLACGFWQRWRCQEQQAKDACAWLLAVLAVPERAAGKQCLCVVAGGAGGCQANDACAQLLAMQRVAGHWR